MKNVHAFGFSLIEIIVVVGIMASVTGFILVSYNNFNTNQKLKQAAKTLRSDLRFVQTRAYSGLKPSGVVCTNIVGYQLSFTATTYSYQAVCFPAVAVTPTTIQLPDQITFSPIPSTFTFAVLTGTASQDVTLSLTKGSGSPITVRVSKSGDVSEL